MVINLERMADLLQKEWITKEDFISAIKAEGKIHEKHVERLSNNYEQLEKILLDVHSKWGEKGEVDRDLMARAEKILFKNGEVIHLPKRKEEK